MGLDTTDKSHVTLIAAGFYAIDLIKAVDGGHGLSFRAFDTTLLLPDGNYVSVYLTVRRLVSAGFLARTGDEARPLRVTDAGRKAFDKAVALRDR